MLRRPGDTPGGKPRISTWRRESLRQRDGFGWRIDELSEAIAFSRIV
jgi:hypothetical protein